MNDYFKDYFIPLLQNRADNTHSVEKIIDKTLSVFESKSANLNTEGKIKLLTQLKTGLFVRFVKIVDEQKDLFTTEKQGLLEKGLDYLFEETKLIINKSSDKVRVKLNRNDLKPDKTDTLSGKFFKSFKNTFQSKKAASTGIPYDIKFRRTVMGYFPNELYEILYETLEEFGKYNISFIYEYHSFVGN